MGAFDEPVPVPRLLRSASDAEEAAAEWMRWLGFADARVTPPGPDGGVDIAATGALAQVKAHMAPVGRPELQALFGVAAASRSRPLFFSLAGYTREALEWAEGVAMPLLRFDHAGGLEAANGTAGELLGPGPRRPGDGSGPLGWPLAAPDGALAAALRLERRGFFGRERVVWIRQAWIWVQAVRLDHTLPGRRGAVVHRAATVAFDLVGGAPLPLPPGDPDPLPGGTAVVAAAVKAPELVRRCGDTFARWQAATTVATKQRHAAALAGFAVPADALSLQVTMTERLAVPVAAALLATRSGARMVALPAWRKGPALPALSAALTARLPWATGQFEAVGRLLVDARGNSTGKAPGI